MSSRAKKKKKGSEPSEQPPGTDGASMTEKKREPVVFTILGLLVFVAGGVFLGVYFSDSWTIGLVCGGVAFVLGSVLVWRGESLLDGLSGL